MATGDEIKKIVILKVSTEALERVAAAESLIQLRYSGDPAAGHLSLSSSARVGTVPAQLAGRRQHNLNSGNDLASREDVHLTLDQINMIKTANICDLIIMDIPVGDGTFVKYTFSVDTGMVYLADGKVLGDIETLFPAAAQQYREALSVRHEWLDDATSTIIPPPEEKKNTPGFRREKGETWRLLNPAASRAVKPVLGKPEDAPLAIFFRCVEKPEKYFAAIYKTVPKLNWNDEQDIARIIKWRGQQVQRVTQEAFRFGQDSEQEWTQEEHDHACIKFRRIIDYMAPRGLNTNAVLKRMNWKLFHERIDRRFECLQPKGSKLAQEHCDKQVEGSKAKRQVLPRDRHAFAKTVEAVRERILACMKQITELRLQPERITTEWDQYINPADHDSDDGDDSDDKPGPDKTSRDKVATGRVTKSVSKGKTPTKSSSKARQKLIENEVDAQNQNTKTGQKSKAKSTTPKKYPKGKTQSKDTAIEPGSDAEHDVVMANTEEEYVPQPTTRSGRQIRAPARTSSPAAIAATSSGHSHSARAPGPYISPKKSPKDKSSGARK